MSVIQRKHEPYKKYRYGTISYNSYKSICNEVSGRLRRAKKQYLSDKFEYLKNNIRSTWKLTNTILGESKKSSTNISIQPCDSLITNESDVSNLFNTYFSTKFHNMETFYRILMPTHHHLTHFAFLIAPLMKLKFY